MKNCTAVLEFLRRSLPVNACATVAQYFFFFAYLKVAPVWLGRGGGGVQASMWKLTQTNLVSIGIKPDRCGYRDDGNAVRPTGK